ncbi:MAG: hypothetical protein AB1589_20315, partial [Cyanobacteriota bacterium]
MNPMLANFTRLSFLNSLQWIHLLGASSAVIFLALAGSGIQPAQANSPELKTTSIEPDPAQELSDLEKFHAQEQESSAVIGVQAVEQPPDDVLLKESI